jgi:hypothetical protein
VPGHGAGPEVLDQDIGAPDQLGQLGTVGLVGQVGGEGPLVAVDGQEVGRLVAGKRWPPRPGVVTDARTLDLDHVRAEVAEEHRRVRCGEYPAEVGDDDSGQRPLDSCGHRSFLAIACTYAVLVVIRSLLATRPCFLGPQAPAVQAPTGTCG